MSKKILAALAPVVVAAVGGALTPALASDASAPATITRWVSDTTPASGETFRVGGKLTRDGSALAGKTVKVQTLRNGAWQNISGASMTTSSTGKYNLRLVLSQKGERTMRVVAVLPGVDPVKRFIVTVH